MSPFHTPQFRGRKALILHRHGDATRRLTRQLERLGMSVECHWPDFPSGGESTDVIFFDADNGFDGLFPWQPGTAPMPLIALLGSELPSRLEWALAQGTSAHIVKPVQSSGVFSALVIGFANFARSNEVQDTIAGLQGRLASRAAVVRAVVRLTQASKVDEDTAFACIRSAAMDKRITVEDYCERLDKTRLAELVHRLLRTTSANQPDVPGKSWFSE